MLGGWGPMADLFYSVLVLLLESPEARQFLITEIRESFTSYKDITPNTKLMSLPYLHACIEETLRILPSNNTGLPRVSSGAVVDGKYIPQGVGYIFFALLIFTWGFAFAIWFWVL
jgi:cytochrome P450